MAHLHHFGFEVFHSCIGTSVLAALAGVGGSVHVWEHRNFLYPQRIDNNMHMNVAAVVVSVRVGADNGLVSFEMLGAKFLAQLLRPINGQSVVRPVAGVKADNVVMAFHILALLVFPVSEICPHTRYGKIFLAAVQRRYSEILA